MNGQHATLNIKMLWTDKEALLNYAHSEGESVSVIVRKMIKEVLTLKGFLIPVKNADFNKQQDYQLFQNHSNK
jgi:hypothetical protein